MNRTLISDATNRLIRDTAPGDYLKSSKVFPQGATEEVLSPHFLGGEVGESLLAATDELQPEQVNALYEGFLASREAAILREIRQRGGVEGREG